MTSRDYGWDGVGEADTNSPKSSLSIDVTPIDPSFAQGSSDDAANFSSDQVAQAVAKAQQVAQAAVIDEHHQQHPHTPQPHDGDNGTSDDMGVPLTNSQGRALSTSRRAYQNRQAQRAFRQRKDMYIKDLEAKVNELNKSKDVMAELRKENLQLRDYILALQSRLIEHPSGMPTPPAVYSPTDVYDSQKRK